MRQVIKVTGKAKNVFKYIDVMARHNGNISIEKLAKGKQSRTIELA